MGKTLLYENLKTYHVHAAGQRLIVQKYAPRTTNSKDLSFQHFQTYIYLNNSAKDELRKDTSLEWKYDSKAKIPLADEVNVGNV